MYKNLFAAREAMVRVVAHKYNKKKSSDFLFDAIHQVGVKENARSVLAPVEDDIVSILNAMSKATDIQKIAMYGQKLADIGVALDDVIDHAEDIVDYIEDKIDALKELGIDVQYDEEDLEEGRAFIDARDKAVAKQWSDDQSLASTFTFNGKEYPVLGVGFDDVQRIVKRFDKDGDGLEPSETENLKEEIILEIFGQMGRHIAKKNFARLPKPTNRNEYRRYLMAKAMIFGTQLPATYTYKGVEYPMSDAQSQGIEAEVKSLENELLGIGIDWVQPLYLDSKEFNYDNLPAYALDPNLALNGKYKPDFSPSNMKKLKEVYGGVQNWSQSMIELMAAQTISTNKARTDNHDHLGSLSWDNSVDNGTQVDTWRNNRKFWNSNNEYPDVPNNPDNGEPLNNADTSLQSNPNNSWTTKERLKHLNKVGKKVDAVDDSGDRDLDKERYITANDIEHKRLKGEKDKGHLSNMKYQRKDIIANHGADFVKLAAAWTSNDPTSNNYGLSADEIAKYDGLDEAAASVMSGVPYKKEVKEEKHYDMGSVAHFMADISKNYDVKHSGKRNLGAEKATTKKNKDDQKKTNRKRLADMETSVDKTPNPLKGVENEVSDTMQTWRDGSSDSNGGRDLDAEKMDAVVQMKAVADSNLEKMAHLPEERIPSVPQSKIDAKRKELWSQCGDDDRMSGERDLDAEKKQSDKQIKDRNDKFDADTASMTDNLLTKKVMDKLGLKEDHFEKELSVDGLNIPTAGDGSDLKMTLVKGVKLHNKVYGPLKMLFKEILLGKVKLDDVPESIVKGAAELFNFYKTVSYNLRQKNKSSFSFKNSMTRDLLADLRIGMMITGFLSGLTDRTWRGVENHQDDWAANDLPSDIVKSVFEAASEVAAEEMDHFDAVRTKMRVKRNNAPKADPEVAKRVKTGNKDGYVAPDPKATHIADKDTKAVHKGEEPEYFDDEEEAKDFFDGKEADKEGKSKAEVKKERKKLEVSEVNEKKDDLEEPEINPTAGKKIEKKIIGFMGQRQKPAKVDIIIHPKYESDPHTNEKKLIGYASKSTVKIDPIPVVDFVAVDEGPSAMSEGSLLTGDNPFQKAKALKENVVIRSEADDMNSSYADQIFVDLFEAGLLRDDINYLFTEAKKSKKSLLGSAAKFVAKGFVVKAIADLNKARTVINTAIADADRNDGDDVVANIKSLKKAISGLLRSQKSFAMALQAAAGGSLLV